MADFKRLLEAYETWKYEKSYKAAMEEIYGDKFKVDSIVEVDRVWGLKTMVKVMSGANYELAMNIVGILNVFSLIVRQLNQETST